MFDVEEQTSQRQTNSTACHCCHDHEECHVNLLYFIDYFRFACWNLTVCNEEK
jgi:hypothetical protein